MKLFCTSCGTPHEVTGTGPVTCSRCGNVFSAPSQAGQAPGAKKGGVPAWAIVLLVVGGLGIPCVIGILAAIAIPNFIRFQARSRQSEVRTHLQTAFMAHRAYFQEKGTYATEIAEVGFSPDRGNRYAYFFAPLGPIEERTGPTTEPPPGAVGVGVDTFKHRKAQVITAVHIPRLAGGVPVGISGDCAEECHITVVGLGNIDNDDTLDVWSISSAEREDAQGVVIPPGKPHQEIDDLKD